MSNNINFGSVPSYYGNGVDNTIFWGAIYKDLANTIAGKYQERVLADGGVIESLQCLNI